MKKIMIALAVAMGLVGVSQASSYYWGISKVAGNKAYYDNGDTVYVLLSSDFNPETTTQAQMLEKAFIMNGDSAAGSAYAKTATKYGIADTAFNYGASDVSGETLDVVFVQVGDDNKFFSWEETLTSTASTSTDKTIQSYSTDDIAGFKTAAGGYKSFATGGDVPEPTSGLLLLIGMAGLALKRKVA